MTARRKITVERTARVLAIISAAGQAGIGKRDLCAQVECSEQALRTYLKDIRDRVTVISGNLHAVFVLNSNLDAARLQKAETLANLRRKRGSEAWHKRRDALLEAATEGDDRPFRHVLTDAATAPPLRVRGPTSVFDLGSM